MAFDILKFYNDHKGFYGDMPLEDVAKDAYNRGFNNGEADFDTWKQSAGIGSILEEDRKRRNPTFEDKLRSQVEQKPAESNLLKSFVQGAAEGVTTEIPSMVGGALEFTGSHLPFKGIERAGKTIKDWAEEKRQELYGPEIERTGLDRIVYEGTKMLAPSLIPGFVVGAGARALKGVNALAKAGKMAEATAAAESATNIAAGSVAGLFGLSQAQQTKDTAEKEGVAPGLAPYATGIIEATGEFLGTKYLAKLFRLDEAEAFKRGGGQLVKDLIKTLGVEVGTEIGQAGGEAAVEKYTGVRPNANPIQEAIDVIGPTAFMTILTGGIAHAANRVDSKKPEEKEASQYIEKLKAGAMLSMDIDKGLITGELNGKPFSVQDAINSIKFGQGKGLYDSSDIDRFKDRYPQLRDALNGVIAENITKKVDEAVTNTVTNTLTNTTANLSDVKLLPGGQGFELKGEPYQEGVTVGDPYGDVLRPVKRKSEDNVIDAEFNTVRRIEAPKKEETKLLPGQGFELSETDQDEISTLQERIQKVQNFLDKNEKHKGGKKYQQVADRLEEDKARLAELTNTEANVNIWNGVAPTVLRNFPDMLEAEGGGIGINNFSESEQQSLRDNGLIYKNEEGHEVVNTEGLWKQRKKFQNDFSIKEQNRIYKEAEENIAKGGEDNGTLRETETTVEEKPGETSAATPWFQGGEKEPSIILTTENGKEGYRWTTYDAYPKSEFIELEQFKKAYGDDAHKKALEYINGNIANARQVSSNKVINEEKENKQIADADNETLRRMAESGNKKAYIELDRRELPILMEQYDDDNLQKIIDWEKETDITPSELRKVEYAKKEVERRKSLPTAETALPAPLSQTDAATVGVNKGKAGESLKEPWQQTRKEFNNNSVESAAIKIGDKVYTAQTHPQAINKAIDEGELKQSGEYDYTDKNGNKINYLDLGLFKLGNGKLITREEATKITGGKAFAESIANDKSDHKTLVEQALSENKPVPEEVLKDYPELQNAPAKVNMVARRQEQKAETTLKNKREAAIGKYRNHVLEKNPKSGNEFADKIVKLIDDRDGVELRKWMNGINPRINKLFYDLTGLPARTQKEVDASLRSLDPEKWDTYVKEHKEFVENKIAERKEFWKNEKINAEIDKKVKHEGQVLTKRELYDKLIGDGFTRILEGKRGVVPIYELNNPNSGMSIKIDKKIEAEYLRKRIEEKAKETKKEAPKKTIIEKAPPNGAENKETTHKTFGDYTRALGYDFPIEVEKKAQSPLAEFNKRNEKKLKANGITAKQLVQKFREDKGKITEAITPKVTLAEGKELENKVIPTTAKDEKNVVTPKEQKKYLLEKIDEALREAPDVNLKMAQHNYKYATQKDISKWFDEDKKVFEANREKYGTVTIEVPNDGTFNILNVKSSLEQFKKQTVTFPASVIKESPGLKTPMPSKRVTGKRLELEDVSYYNEFKPREQGLVEGKREPATDKIPEVNQNFYVDGYFTNGHYLVKTEKPKFKLSNNKPDVKRVIPKDAGSPAKIVAEFYKGGGKDRETAAVHAIAEDGTENAFNAHYVDSILTLYPDAKAFMTPGMKPMVFKKGKEVVGLVMPIRDNVPSQEFIDEFKAEQNPPKNADMFAEKKAEAVEKAQRGSSEPPSSARNPQGEISSESPLSSSNKSHVKPSGSNITPSNESVNKESATADSGEELKYNKRNRIRTGIKWEDISDKNTALKVKETNKQNVYPRPDYQQMIDDGVEPLIANIVKQVYDSIPIKPETRGIPTDEDLKLYITAVNRVMDGAIKWANDKNAIAAWAGKQAKTAGAMLGKVTSLSDLTEKDSKLLDFVYPEGYKSYLAEIRMLGGNKLLRVLQPGYEHGKKALKEVQTGWPTKQESWQRQGLRIINGNDLSTDTYTGKDNHDNPYTYAYINAKIDGRTIEIERRIFEGAESKDTPAVQEYLNSRKDFLKDKQILLDKRHKIIGDYNSLEEAQEAAREKVKRENKPTINEKGISVEQAERIGVARRLEGENISTDKLRETFGFRGVNFGNWMKGGTNETERQLHLNHAYDSFMDLAELLNVPPQALSLNGMLGVAIGAQGSGDKAAHFVPGVNEINLTRTAGAGTLAHEWAHALDHYFARMAGLEGSGEPFLTEHATQSPTRTAAEKQVDGTYKKVTKSTFSGNIRPEIIDLFKKIVNSMNSKELTVTPEEQTKETQERLVKAKESVSKWLKAIRRDWFAGQEEAFDKLADRIMNNDMGEGKVAASSTTYLSPVVAEIRELSKKTKGRNIPLDNIKSLQANIDHYEYLNSKKDKQHEPVMRRIDTEYSKNATKLDREKGGKPYWSQNLEKFARAFDAYISDSLEANAAKNTYLSHAGRSGETVPQGTERETINKAFSELIKEIKTRETDKGVEMYKVQEKGAYRMPTLKDVQEVFKGQKVTQFPNGAYLIETRNGASVIVSAVDKITPSKISLSIGYSKTGISENEAIAGKYDKGMIDLVKGQADKWTLAHESVHFMEDIGVINDQEAKLLKRHIQNLTSEGKWQTLNKDDIGGAEDRAEFLAQSLQKEPKGLLGRIINKVQDFIDMLANAFGVRTVRGITRDIKTGEIYGHETGAQREARLDLEGEMYAVKNKTKTPEFKKWFGDSKVVDENGNPLVVYHGTYSDINVFKTRRDKYKNRLGAYFTESEKAAKRIHGGVDIVLPIHLSIQNPFDLRNVAREEIANKIGLNESIQREMLTQGRAGVYATLEWLDKKYDIIPKLKRRGYDGVVFDGGHEGITWVAFKPTQIKSSIGNNGNFDAENPDIRYAIRTPQDPPASSDPKVLNLYLKDETDAIVQTIMNKLHPKNMSWLETMLKSPEWFDHPQIQNIVKLFMRDRNEIYHETFNELNAFNDSTVTDAAKALRNKGLSATERLAGKVSPEYQKLMDMIDDGDTRWVRNTKVPLETQLKQFEDAWRKKGATDEIINVWRSFRQSYDKALDLMTQQLRDMIDEIKQEATAKGEKPDLSELNQTLKGALAQMEEWRGFYAPRQRRGNWAVQAYKEHGPLEQNREWYRKHHESELSAQREAKQLERDGWKIYKVGEAEKLPESVYQDVRAVSTAKLIDAALEKLGKKSDIAESQMAKFNEEILKEVSDMIKSRGFRSTMIHRGRGNVVRGFVEDPIERHLMYINNLSGGISKARVARMAMKELLGDKVMGEQVGGIDPAKDPKAFTTAQNYIQEQLRNTDASDRIIGLAKSIATFKFLGFNLRSLAVNTTAILTTAPAAIHQYVTGGKGSLTEIFRELAKSGKDYGAVMAGKDLGNPDEAAFIDDVHKKGWDDAQYTREALGEISKTHSRIWSTMMDASMYLFGKSEKWNRGTTMLAAYRLARKQGLDHAQAAEAAKTSSDKAHGVYGKSTMPMWAQGTNPASKIGQMMYVYSKFGHNYLQMLYDMGFKQHNIKGAMFAFLSPLVLAGGAAMPFKDAIFGLASVILGLLGYDDDPEKWVWDEIREHLGMGAEKVGRHGLTGAMGVDISGSLSIGVGIPKNFIDLTGAIGGVGTEIKEAGENLGRGNVGRAAEHLLPTGLSNPLRAMREAEEGVSTRNNRRVWDEKGRPYVPGIGESVSRSLGFRSTDQAVLSERTWEGHKQQTAFAEKRNRIYERYRAWLLGGRDREEYKKIVKEVQDFNAYIRRNKIRGESFITSQSLRNQVRRMQKPSRKERSILEE